jgi:hypothetical protein
MKITVHESFLHHPGLTKDKKYAVVKTMLLPTPKEPNLPDIKEVYIIKNDTGESLPIFDCYVENFFDE